MPSLYETQKNVLVGHVKLGIALQGCLQSTLCIEMLSWSARACPLSWSTLS